VVAWHGFDPATTTYNIHAQRFGADGAPMGEEVRVNAVGASIGSLVEPAIIGLAGGGFVVSWAARDPATGSNEVHARRYGADGAAGGGDFRVNTTTANDQSGPAVAAFADGGFAVAWQSHDPAVRNNDIHARRFAADGTAVGGEFRANAAAAENQYEPAIAAVSDGGFVVAWAGHDPTSGYRIEARRFGSDGQAIDGDFRVGAVGTAADREFGARISGLANGGFVVSWAAEDFPALDSRVQRFALPPDAAEVRVARSGPSTAEGHPGATAFAFAVSLDVPADTAQSVGWRLEGSGAAPAGASDFAGGTLPSGTVVFNPGETSKTILVRVADDATAEADEGFAVRLSDPSVGLAIGAAGAATAAILDDDLPVATGSDGADVFAHPAGQGRAYEGLGGRDVLDFGGQGFRGVLGAPLPDGAFLSAAAGNRAVLRGVEEARFADGRLVMDDADPAAQVVRLYEAALDRLPDQSGLNFWIGAVQGGQPLSALASGFLGSPEFASRFGGAADNGAFVDRLYLNVLGRAGEAEGRAFWAGTLDGGVGTRADVLAAFSESAENKAGTAALVRAGIWDRGEAAAEVARLYDTVFGRLPDAQGLAYWKGALEGGTATRAQMADAFTGSAEFRAKYDDLDNWDFADVLYWNSLNRPAGRPELLYWEGLLDGGMSRAAVVLAFSESAEHVALTAGNVGGENPADFGVLFG
jgi:hypothetical protein